MARVTGLEPAAFRVTGGRSNQLSYTRARVLRRSPYATIDHLVKPILQAFLSILCYSTGMLITLDRPLAKTTAPIVTFTKHELKAISAVYSTYLAKGIWRDYALDFEREMAAFSFFRHAHEQPQAAVIKTSGNTATGWIFEVLHDRKTLSRTPFLDKALASLHGFLEQSLTN